MEELNLFLRICLTFIFLSSFSSKVKDMQRHILIIKDYRIIPDRLSAFFAKANIVLELIIGVGFLTGLFIQLTALVALSVLIIYSAAVGINLFRGRKKISCGCGGIVGTHLLSWWLIGRNIIFILVCIWFLTLEQPPKYLIIDLDSFMTIQFIKTASYSTVFLMIIATVNYLFMVKRRFNSFIYSISLKSNKGAK